MIKYKLSQEGELQRLLKDNYLITGRIKPLNGEKDLNFQVLSDTGKMFLLKISSISSIEAEQDFQVQLINYLANRDFKFEIPIPVEDKDGRFLFSIFDQDGTIRFVRLQTWVEGRMLDEIRPWDNQIMCSWGNLCGSLSRELADFVHPMAHRDYAWDPVNCLKTRKFKSYLNGVDKQDIAEYFWQRFEVLVIPELKGLRWSVNYNDAHEQNLLVSDGDIARISGLIDFGDAVYTLTINELAIACAYAMMRSVDPLRSVCELIRNYHDVFPIQEKELRLLYDLIAARLIITVAHAAYNAALHPDNKYLQVSDKAAWSLLNKWRSISPQFAHCYFRFACGLEPSAIRSDFDHYLKSSGSNFRKVMKFKERVVQHVDLSVSSTQLGHFTQVETLERFEKWMIRYKEDEKVDILYGGYLEPRNFYSTDHYTEMGLFGPQWRSIHAGLDLWSDSREPIYAVHAGNIKYLRNNTGRRNYGPTIILEHQMGNGGKFYSLYGHLTQDSLGLHKEGNKVKAGQLIAYVGNSNENGEWPPHLHFQVMLDLLDMVGDFPGVVYPHEKKIWASICPDPGKLIGMEKEDNLTFSDTETLLMQRNSLLGKNLSLSYEAPIHVVRGQLQYLLDDSGRKYLDTVNNVAHVGHEHPVVVDAIAKQSAVLNTNTRYLHENILLLAEQLLEKLPAELELVYFVNSGSEANELAVRICEHWTGSNDMIVIDSGYHGNTGRCVELSSYKFNGKGGKGAGPNTHVVDMPDIFRGKHREKSDAASLYAGDIDLAIENIRKKGSKLSGFIAESILSCGGQIVLPQDYLAQAYKKVRAAGGLCIADEVQTGLGRTGNHFWAFQHHHVVPDIVTIGKPLGNGHPIAAVACTRAVADSFANGMEYFNTFGGNPVSAAAGSAVLSVLDEEDSMLQAAIKGEYWKAGLRNLQENFPVIGDVRGNGLFLGFELVNNEELEPAAQSAHYLINRMRQMGILMSSDGPHHNVIKIKPPMCITRQNIDLSLEILEFVLREDPMRI